MTELAIAELLETKLAREISELGRVRYLEISRRREEIVEAFIAQHDLPPDEVRQEVQYDPDGSTSFRVVRVTPKTVEVMKPIYVVMRQGPLTGIVHEAGFFIHRSVAESWAHMHGGTVVELEHRFDGEVAC